MSAKRKPVHPKVAAGSIGAMVSTIVLWMLGMTGVKPPPDAAAAIAGLVATAFAYFAPHLDAESVPEAAATGRPLELAQAAG